MTPPPGPGRPPGTCSSRPVASRPRCSATARCSSGTMPTRMTRSRAPRCTTRPAGPGPPRARWSAADGGTATLLRDGKVLVTAMTTARELYDPDSGTWTATGKMITPRHSQTATLLPDGKVLVAGGHAPPTLPTDSAELYDPDTGSWTAIANMQAPQRDHRTAFAAARWQGAGGGSERSIGGVRPGHRNLDRTCYADRASLPIPWHCCRMAPC